MDIKVSSKRVANNILEFLVDPSVFPIKRRIYFRPEEILMNESFEKAKKESEEAYGDQRHNSDFYPNRPLLNREASMERKHIIASLDVLSQEFVESDPMARDLRTMAFAIAKMSDDQLGSRLVEAGNPWMDHMKKVREKNKGMSLPELIAEAKKTYKKAEEEKPEVKEEEKPEVKEEEKPEAEEEEVKEASDVWTKKASDAIRKALKAEIVKEEEVEACGDKKDKKEAGDKKGPGVPDKDGKGPLSGTPACPKTEVEEKEAAAPVVEKEEEEEKEEEKEATKVDTDLLKSSAFGDIEMEAGLVTMDDIGDLSETEQNRLSQLFHK